MPTLTTEPFVNTSFDGTSVCAFPTTSVWLNIINHWWDNPSSRGVPRLPESTSCP